MDEEFIIKSETVDQLIDILEGLAAYEHVTESSAKLFRKLANQLKELPQIPT